MKTGKKEGKGKVASKEGKSGEAKVKNEEVGEKG